MSVLGVGDVVAVVVVLGSNSENPASSVRLKRNGPVGFVGADMGVDIVHWGLKIGRKTADLGGVDDGVRGVGACDY